MKASSKTSRGVVGQQPIVPRKCQFCGSSDAFVAFTYNQPVVGEITFGLSPSIDYWREIHRCRQCGHFLDWHEMDLGSLYSSDYVSSTYGGPVEIREAFERIINLPVQNSDNAARINRVQKFLQTHQDGSERGRQQLLDIGSGLCVFAHQMNAAGWKCTCLEVDKRLADHARLHVGVEAHLADVTEIQGLGCFDLITLNKVVEHVENPVHTLERAQQFLKPNGILYLEVPDGEVAVGGGKKREEFFLGHLHVFSAASLALMIANARYHILQMERLREPSGKYTLFAFAQRGETDSGLAAARTK